MEWFLGILIVLGIFSVFTIERRLGSVLHQFHILQCKIDLALKQLGIEDATSRCSGLSAKVQEIARNPARKIEAITVHREESGASLKEAKEAVESLVQQVYRTS